MVLSSTEQLTEVARYACVNKLRPTVLHHMDHTCMYIKEQQQHGLLLLLLYLCSMWPWQRQSADRSADYIRSQLHTPWQFTTVCRQLAGRWPPILVWERLPPTGTMCKLLMVLL